MVNVDPFPASLSTRTAPPIISQKWRVMANLWPVPSSPHNDGRAKHIGSHADAVP